MARVFTPHPIQDRTDDEMRAYADAAYDDIVAAITNRLATTPRTSDPGAAPAPNAGNGADPRCRSGRATGLTTWGVIP